MKFVSRGVGHSPQRVMGRALGPRVDAKLFEFGLEGGAFEPEADGGAVRADDQAVAFAQSHEDVLAFGAFKSLVVEQNAGGGLQLAERNGQDRTGGEDQRALDEILQFTDISGPRPADECVHRPFRNAGDRLLHAARDLLYKVLDEQGNVFAALAQGWKENGKDVEAVKQIAAKFLVADALSQVAVGGGDQAKIDFQLCVPPRRSNS